MHPGASCQRVFTTPLTQATCNAPAETCELAFWRRTQRETEKPRLQMQSLCTRTTVTITKPPKAKLVMDNSLSKARDIRTSRPSAQNSEKPELGIPPKPQPCQRPLADRPHPCARRHALHAPREQSRRVLAAVPGQASMRSAKAAKTATASQSVRFRKSYGGRHLADFTQLFAVRLPAVRRQVRKGRPRTTRPAPSLECRSRSLHSLQRPTTAAAAADK